MCLKWSDKLRAVLLLCMMTGAFLFSAGERVPDSAWQAGILDGMSAEVQDRGGVVSNNVIIPMSGTLTHFSIRAQQFIYHADRSTVPRDKPLLVTIHGKLTFAIVGNAVYIQDEQGKVHKLSFVSKELIQ